MPMAPPDDTTQNAANALSLGTLAFAGASFAVGVVVTAIVQRATERFWKRPRPVVRVVHISIGPKPDAAEANVEVPAELVEAARRSPLLPELQIRMKARSLQQYREFIETVLQTHQAVSSHLKAILDRPNLLPPGESLDAQRVSLLKDWTRMGGVIDQLAEAAIRVAGDAVPDAVRASHPPEWRDEMKCSVNIGTARYYNLSELDPAMATVMGGSPPEQQVVAAVLEARNVLRRFWIHMNEGDLRWLIGNTLKLFDAVESEARPTAERIDQLLASAMPDFLRVETLITNDGDRAFGVRPLAQMKIDCGPKGAASLPLKMEQPATPLVPMGVVLGNSALPTVFSSEEPLNRTKLAVGGATVDGEFIRTLYTTQTVRARIAVLPIGFGKDSPAVLASDWHGFGQQVDSAARQSLLDATTRS